MQETTIEPELMTAVLAIQNEVAKVKKDKNNPHHKNNYPTLEAVLDVLNPQFQKHNLAVVQFPQFDDKSGEWVLITLISKEGKQYSFPTPLLGVVDSKNKMQALGSAMTYARRQSHMGFFKLAPTDDDGNEVMPPQPVNNPKPKTQRENPPAQQKRQAPPQQQKQSSISPAIKQQIDRIVANMQKATNSMKTNEEKGKYWRNKLGILPQDLKTKSLEELNTLLQISNQGQ